MDDVRGAGRSYKILEVIVDEYIRTGEPVGSNALKEKLKGEFNVSAATIRNEMASLEAQGYLNHPHTSAGRIPTIRGLRLYVERMSPERKLSKEDKAEIDDFFTKQRKKSGTDEEIITSANKALAELTKSAIVSVNSITRFSVITKVEVIPTGKRMYVLLMITSDGGVKNKVCRLTFDLTNEQLDFFSRFVRENLEGVTSDQISESFFEQLSEALGAYMTALSPLMKAFSDLSADLRESRILIEGETNLIASDALPKNEIAALLQKKNEFSQLLDKAFSGINVVFGKEKDTFAAENTGIITGNYRKKGKYAGSVGIIGPLRLDYKRLIPYIEYFTEKMSETLSESETEELQDN
jgi:heat-inducible transcriptional repressor